MKHKKLLISFIAVAAAACIILMLMLPKKTEGGDEFSVVTTVFPLYDWARELCAGNADAGVSMLLENGGDLHSFQPSVRDIARIAAADVFVYVGGESEFWVNDVLSSLGSSGPVAVNLMDALSFRVLEEEIKEGMQEDESDVAEESVYDEHLWLSLKNAVICVQKMSDAFSAVDVKNAPLYEANASRYQGLLLELDGQYERAVEKAGGGTLIFADRFPFRYLFEDYGLDYFAAFPGCSAETEASFKTVRFLVDKIDVLEKDCVYVIESSDGKLAKTVLENSARQDRNVIVLDSMQSASKKDVSEGMSYLGVMRSNLEQIRKGL